jgi:flagellar biosynthetic protein FlhB
MAEQDSDRSEQATPHRLQEARKKGSVSRSVDVTALAILAVLVLVIQATGWDTVRVTAQLQRRILSHIGHADWTPDGAAAWMGELLVAMLSVLAPLFLALVVVAVLANVVQTGPVFTSHPLKPDFDRINPASGFKRVFSLRTLFEAGKSVVKLIVLSAVVYAALRDLVPGLIGLSGADARGYLRVLVGLCAALLVKLVFTQLVIAAVDFGFVRRDFAKRMRMSKRDVKDEHKNREGDPRIRSRIRELRKEMLKRSKAAAKVPEADVLITNPTRLAVALSYRHGTSGAPQVVAKGAGDLARKMREVAARHQIPIVQNRPLARTLFREVDFEGYVPEKLYPQIAKIMVWVYAMRDARRNQQR